MSDEPGQALAHTFGGAAENLRRAILSAQALQSDPAVPSPDAALIASVAAAALDAADPYRATRERLALQGEKLWIGDLAYDLSATRRVRVVGMGKAGQAMGQAGVDVLGDRVQDGVIVVKHLGTGSQPGSEARIGTVRLRVGGHPVPSVASVTGAQRVLECLRDGTAQDLVICLISGGGSALLAAPAQGISLEDLQTFTSALLACGATIQEFNCLRKHLDTIKGGGLARTASPAQVVSLILSDVIGSPLDVIASGPAEPDPSTYAEAWEIVEKYGLASRLPASIEAVLRAGLAGERRETPKPGDPIFDRCRSILVGSNVQAARAGLAQAAALGLHTLLLTTYLQGEARQAGQVLAAVARQAAASGEPLPRPACLIAGGETTVTLRQSAGSGGRNQELALGALPDLAGVQGAWLVTLATDGEDGPTDAAGAVVGDGSLRRAQLAGLDPTAYLYANDSYTFFAALGDLLRPGPSGTNVNDLAFLFIL